MTLCSVKNCKSNHRSGSSIHFFRFPLNNENLLNKWIAVVGKLEWKPKKTSRICSLHFSEKDIIRGMGYKYFYLRENAVPKDCSSIFTEKERIDIATLKSKKNYNISKYVSSNETYALNKNIIGDHNYSNNVSTIENDGSNTFRTRGSNQLIQKATFHPNKKCKFITDSEDVCNIANVSSSVSSNETYVLSKSLTWDHNYSKNGINTIIENDESSIFGIRNLNQSFQKAIPQPDKKRKVILIDSKNIIMLSPISHNFTNFNSKKEIDFAAEKIQELSINIKNMRKKNKILQQKLRRYKKKIISMKEMFNQLQNKLTSNDSCY